jgi:hypothetical protein
MFAVVGHGVHARTAPNESRLNGDRCNIEHMSTLQWRDSFSSGRAVSTTLNTKRQQQDGGGNAGQLHYPFDH